MDIPSTLRNSCSVHAARVAVTCGGIEQTYAQLWERACRLANGLRAAGLPPGTRVAILADNGPESLEQIAGIALAGMVRAPLYTQNTAPTNAYLVDRIGADAVLAHHRYAHDLVAAIDRTDLLTLVFGGPSAGDARTRDYEEFLAAADKDDPDVDVDPGTHHIIRFSAGTTGRPKGIVHSGRGWQAMGEEMAAILPPMTPRDAYLAAGPLSHASGLFVWPLLAAGARHVLMPAFDPSGFLDLVERERCTLAFLVPTMVQMITAVPGAAGRDLSSLRAVFYAAAPITDTTLRAGIALWGRIMYQIYGQSEVLPATVLTPDEHELDGPGSIHLRSAGRPTPHSQVTVRDEDDRPLPAGEIGEICVRSPAAMAGIWADETATGDRIAPDGAVRTRDMGHFDQDGYLYLDDRKEDMIISGGYNVYPAEVENALAAHPRVAEAVVVGIPHAKWGETVAAVVVPHPGQVVDESELIQWARERVGPVRKPTIVKVVTDPLPKTGVGKISRRAVKNQHWPGVAGLHGA